MLESYTHEVKKILHGEILKKFPKIELTIDEVVLEKPPSQELGEFAIACFPIAKKLKKNPKQICEEIESNFPKNKYIDCVKSAGPYLNVSLNKPFFFETVLSTILSEGDQFGHNEMGKGQNVMVEYSSPNTNKPLHIGHVRNNVLGMALANILDFCGFHVIKANLVNDRGVHICKSMLAYQKWGNGVTPDSANKKGDHLVGEFYVKFETALKEERKQFAKKQNLDMEEFSGDSIKELKSKIGETDDKNEKEKLKKKLQTLKQKADKFEEDFLEQSSLYQEALEMLRQWEDGVPEVRSLWQTMNGWVMDGFFQTYRTLGCSFDKIYKESETYSLGKDYVVKGVEDGIFYKKEDGSVWVSAQKLIEACPEEFKGIELKDKLLLRSDGTSVYITQDIGTAILKAKDYGLNRSIYVVASEQILHFKNLFAILKMMGFPWAKGCYHLAYGMVTLPHGMGKIKSREGTAVDADDLVEEMAFRAKEKMHEANLRVPEEKLEQTALDIALAALKVFILQVSVEKDIQFDPTKSIDFQGDTGPAIQYSYARISSIFRKASEQNVLSPSLNTIDYALLNSSDEYALIRHLYEFPEIIACTARTYNIGLLVNYLLVLTKLYASIYAAYWVLKAETSSLRDARLVLAKATAQTIKNGMKLLGISVPESM